MSEHVYEIVDTTSEENYWTLGIYLTLVDALGALGNKLPNKIPGDHDDYEDLCHIEIRERKIGWSGVGKQVWERTWVRKYEPNTDEYEWKIQEQK